MAVARIIKGARVREAGRCVVLDIVFVVLSVAFFVVSAGYVIVCDRLMR
jgi:hypothetical protein